VQVRALSDITLSLNPGDRVAILGGNGAGKSTLLKIIAGIMEPSIGRAVIEGSVSSLLETSMGMDLEATGYENIVMRSVFLGATFEEARARIPEIEEFSGLGEYLAFPMRTYSSGMMVRLAFAVSTSFMPEILVLDEHIGAADATFSIKAKQRMVDLSEKAQILVFATHSMDAANSLCTRGIVLDKGSLRFDGPVAPAIQDYQQMVSHAV
jgi:ABC-2 type transport system ATP-binding protein/lipopolysaccharide transport system ATP-binding protein